MNPPPHSLLVALLATIVPSAARSAQEPAPARASNLDARPLFKTYCAACHGETGDGNGTTKLDRPARSFKDGGFSYGNTPDAIAKTLQYGIPGSVMPSFGTTLSEEQRIALAKYVIELGPQDMPAESPDRVMVVKDRAVVARGKLPPIVEGGEEIPRGLLVGTPDGFTFAYRTDDLRLLAVYQGEFAERTDWMGRGGTQLKPLGKLVASFGCVAPPARANAGSLLSDHGFGCVYPLPPAKHRLVRSEVTGPTVSIEYDVEESAVDTRQPARTVARVRESATGIHTQLGRGWMRTFVVEPRAGGSLELCLGQWLDGIAPSATEPRVVKTGADSAPRLELAESSGDFPVISEEIEGRVWRVESRTDGSRCLFVNSNARAAVVDGQRIHVRCDDSQQVRFVVKTVPIPAWSDDMRAAARAEAFR
jgi:mono/diheme cytochrome c family protein